MATARARHRRSPSAGALAGELVGEALLLKPQAAGRPPVAARAQPGLRTPPTCPASPLLSSSSFVAAPSLGGSRSSCSTPLRTRHVTSALAFDAAPHALPTIVASVYESNITAAACYSAYGRHPVPGLTAPPLVGGTSAPHRAVAGPHMMHDGLLASRGPHAQTALSAGAVAHGSGGLFGHALSHDALASDDFGLAACLSTPMDPGKQPGAGLQKRLAQLPGASTAARGAAAKLTSADDLLNNASRFGEWSRRVRRRRKMERMQGALADLSGGAVLGRVLEGGGLGHGDPLSGGLSTCSTPGRASMDDADVLRAGERQLAQAQQARHATVLAAALAAVALGGREKGGAQEAAEGEGASASEADREARERAQQQLLVERVQWELVEAPSFREALVGGEQPSSLWAKAAEEEEGGGGGLAVRASFRGFLDDMALPSK